jgi:hypothetical protein
MTASTAGFGAIENVWYPQEKRYIPTPFMVTAGHTGQVGNPMYRLENGAYLTEKERRNKGERIGHVARNALTQGTLTVDALALNLQSKDLAPRYIVGGGPVEAPAVVHKHEMVCKSGASSNSVVCGRVIGFTSGELDGYPGSDVGWFVVRSSHVAVKGDSGGPVFRRSDHASVGLTSAYKKRDSHIWLMQPLLTTPYGHGRKIVGALNASIMGSGNLNIVQGE